MKRDKDICPVAEIRKTVITAFLCFLLLLLSACTGPQYKPEEAENIKNLGTEMMQQWLDERLPGEKVTRAEAWIDVLLGGPHELTDYVEGTYTDQGEEFRFLVNTLTGEIFTSKGMEEFRDPAWEYMLEKLELDPLTPQRTKEEGALQDFGYSLYLESATEGSPMDPPHDFYLKPVLPANLIYGEAVGKESEELSLQDRMREFLHDPDRKYPIAVSADLVFPEEDRVSRLTPAGLMKMQETEGLYFDWLRILGDGEELWHYGFRGQYSRYGWIDLGDFRIRTELDFIEDTKKLKSEQGYERRETHVSQGSFCPVTAADDGYQISYPEELEHFPEIRIVAKPGSDILKYNYRVTSDGGETASDCHWKLREDGDWELVNADWVIMNFGYNAELKRRGEFDPGHPETE